MFTRLQMDFFQFFLRVSKTEATLTSLITSSSMQRRFATHQYSVDLLDRDTLLRHAELAIAGSFQSAVLPETFVG